MIKDPIDIQCYMGYGNDKSIYCYGRILKRKFLYQNKNHSKWLQFVNTIKILNSNELAYQRFTYTFQGKEHKARTNSEGYFLIQEAIDTTIEAKPSSVQIRVELSLDKKKKDKETFSQFIEIYFPKPDAEYAVISDMDDTILHTQVLSRFKLKMLYNAFFLSVIHRKAIRGTCEWYQKLHKFKNPFFYVSNSPWNLYEYLRQFLSLNQYPDGPLLLRDFGKKAKDSIQDYSLHKQIEVERILCAYPHLDMILIGDGGERDADIYLEMKKKYSSQVKGIFIRRLGTPYHQSRIEALAEAHKAYFFFIDSVEEAEAICMDKGWI